MKIIQITLTLADEATELKLTIEEARALHKQLDGLFAPMTPTYPQTHPMYPPEYLPTPTIYRTPPSVPEPAINPYEIICRS
jgi:hypothetical protein